MAYVPDADAAGAPLNTELASTAAAEFRALKAKLNMFFTIPGWNATDNTLFIYHGMIFQNTTATPNIAYGTVSQVIRTGGQGPTLGARVVAQLSNGVDQATSGQPFAALWAHATVGGPGTRTSAIYGLNGIQGGVINQNSDGQDGDIVGIKSYFTNRLAAGTPAVGGDQYNQRAYAYAISSDPRYGSEQCGWSVGLHFYPYSLDSTTSRLIPYGIDFEGIEYSSSVKKPLPFNFPLASLVTAIPTDNVGTVTMPTKLQGFLRVSVNNVAQFAIPLCSLPAY